jgi:hypothetical protein
VTEFHPVTDTRNGNPKTICDMELVEPNDRVTPNRRINPTILRVSPGGPLNFHFKIIAADDSGDTYYPIGIGFRLKHNGASNRKDLTARETFASGAVHIYKTSLFFTDNYQYNSRKDLYEFDVIIQSAKDGQVGVIDPGIEHKPA